MLNPFLLQLGISSYMTDVGCFPICSAFLGDSLMVRPFMFAKSVNYRFNYSLIRKKFD